MENEFLLWNMNLQNFTDNSIVVSDGFSPEMPRGGVGNSYRVFILEQGFFDIFVLPNMVVFNSSKFDVNDTTIEAAPFVLTHVSDNTISVTLGEQRESITLTPFPLIDPEMVRILDAMIDSNYIPYQARVDQPGKSNDLINLLGKQYFPFTKYSYELAMTVYDWTTADFTRVDYFRIFMYITQPGQVGELDFESIANAIYGANYQSYKPSNAYYMNSFMMQPAFSLGEVKEQLNRLAPKLIESNEAQLALLQQSLKALPRTCCCKKPKLFSGQVAISNLGTHHFAPYFFEFSKNAEPGKALEIELDEALQTFIMPGKIITTKSPVSFIDNLSGAKKYSNGIILEVDPADDAIYWTNATYITPLSDGPEKAEYLFHPCAQFLVKDVRKDTDFVTIHLKEIV